MKILNFPKNKKTTATLKVVPIAQSERIHSIPIIKQATFFLKHAGTEKGIKLTEKGSLGRHFVQSFWDENLSGPDDLPFRPTREFECPEVTRIHCLLAESKYVRKFKGHIQLTPKGRAVVESNEREELYRDLLEAGMFRWNWGFEDRYPDFEFIQNAAPHLVERLMYWPAPTMTAAEIFESVFGKEHAPAPYFESRSAESESIFDSGEYMTRSFYIRFFERFCVPFGILRGVSDTGHFGTPNDLFEKTEFFVSDFMKIL